MSEEDIFFQRLEKVSQLQNSFNINPYPNKFTVTITVEKALKEIPQGDVSLAGRLVGIRKMGKAAFLNIKDASGKIQLYVKQDNVGEEKYRIFALCDIGDFIGVTGTVFKTKTEEITIRVTDFKILSKSLRPLPEKWHGLKDIETRYRQRYLDLISNDNVVDVFKKRARIISSIRSYLDNSGFTEVETPMMQPIPGGAAAKPFITHHNALDIDLYMRIAPELYLKRLIVGGFERIYELGRTFRNEGISIKHNPEFTILEVYRAYADYTDMMEMCREIVQAAAKAIDVSKIVIGGREIDLFSEWKQISLEQSFKDAGLDMGSDYSEQHLRDLGKKFNIENYAGIPVRKIFDRIFDLLVQPKLTQPIFITDYPKFMSPLAKSKEGNPDIVERFELFIANQEIANAYSELNDPVDQKSRFEQQSKEREKGDDEAETFDADFVRALEHGMPPTGGLGIGIDRLVILLTQQESIKDVILFPLLKPEKTAEK